MVSGEHKRAALHEKLQLLRSITNSHAKSETSIIIDASNYIQELKQKVERLNQETETVKKSSEQKYSWPTLTVETLEKGFLVNVFSDKNCPGLLVFILEAFEELGLNVMEARVSCSASFQLEALGRANEENGENIDAQVVKQAISQAVKIWSEISEKD